MTRELIVNRDGPVATVVLNRPRKLNAMTKRMWRRLGEVMETLSADDAVRCVVLRGAGERAFSPGNDISEFEKERSDVAKARAYGAVMARTLDALGGCRHPVVAEIHGICVGGGLEIASLADIRVCGVSSRFGVPVNRLGLVMSPLELGGLMRLVGRAAALEILLEGRVFGAEEALAKGLVNRVVPDDRVAAEVAETVARIAAGAPLAARWHKQFANRLERPEPLTPAEIDEGYLCFGTHDFQVGYRSFLAKRRPKFTGR